MLKEREYRTLNLELRALDAPDGGGPRFAGYAAEFNTLSDDLGGFFEQIAPGAFAKAIADDDIRCLFNHNADYVLGRNKAGTLRLVEDERGLRFEVDAPDVQWARDLHTSVQRGDVNQCSFAFAVARDAWAPVDGHDVRTLLEVKLFDVSIVTYPAYPSTAVAARSAESVLAEHRESAAALEKQRAETQKTALRAKLNLKEKEIPNHE